MDTKIVKESSMLFSRPKTLKGSFYRNCLLEVPPPPRQNFFWGGSKPKISDPHQNFGGRLKFPQILPYVKFRPHPKFWWGYENMGLDPPQKFWRGGGLLINNFGKRFLLGKNTEEILRCFFFQRDLLLFGNRMRFSHLKMWEFLFFFSRKQFKIVYQTECFRAYYAFWFCFYGKYEKRSLC